MTDFFDLYQDYCPRSSHRPRKFVLYLEDLGQYFSVKIVKTVITSLIQSGLTIICTKLHIPLQRGRA